MNTSNEQQIDEVSLKQLILKFVTFLLYLKSKIIFILISVLIGVFIGWGYTKLVTKKEYTADIKFLAEGSSASSGSSDVASLLGLKPVSGSSGGGSGDIFEALDISYIMSSTPILEKTLLSEITYNNKKDYAINFFMNYRRQEKNIFGKVINYANQKPYDGNRDSLNTAQNEFLRGVISDVFNNLKVERDKSSSLLIGSFKASDPEFPKYFLEKLIEETSKLFTYTKVGKTAANLLLLERQADSVRRLMSNSIESSAYSADIDPNSIKPNTSKTSFQKKQIDNNVLQSTYQTLATSIVNTRIQLGKQTPFIQIFERPIFPLRQSIGSSAKLNMIKFGTITLILSLLYFSAIYFFLGFKKYMTS